MCASFGTHNENAFITSLTIHLNALSPEVTKEQEHPDNVHHSSQEPPANGRLNSFDTQSSQPTSNDESLRLKQDQSSPETSRDKVPTSNQFIESNRRLQRIHYIKQRNNNGRLQGVLRVNGSPEPLSRYSSRKFDARINSNSSPVTTHSSRNSMNSTRRKFNRLSLIRRRRVNLHKSEKPTLVNPGRKMSSNFHGLTRKKSKVTQEVRHGAGLRPQGKGQLIKKQFKNTPMTIIGNFDTLKGMNMTQKIESLRVNHSDADQMTFINGTSRVVRHFRYRPTPQSYIIQRRSKICIFEGITYDVGDKVPTSEPCLECICYERTIICGLRVCPKTSIARDHLERCRVTHTEGVCCPDVECNEGGKKTSMKVHVYMCLLSSECMHHRLCFTH